MRLILFGIFIAAMANVGVAAAQSSSPPAPAPAPAATANPSTPPAPAAPKDDRLFGVLPNYMTVENTTTLPPLTPGQKWALAADGMFDKVEFAFVGALALYNQATDENPSWGQGFGGYAKRYGEAFANQAIENTLVGAALPIALHQDPRYYELAHGGYLHRFAYSASRILVTRGDDGKAEFNASEVLGSFGAAGLSNLYEPRGSRNVDNTLGVWGTQVLIDTGSDELREFWPDLKHRVFRHK